MLTLLLAALLQDTPEDVIKALSDSSAVARGEAAEKIAARGRKAVPLLRQAESKATGEALDEIRKVIGRIGDAEVRELLTKEGHADLADLKVYTDEALTKALPHAAVWLLPGKADCKACGTVGRHAVVNVLADEKGAPARVKEPADIVKLFPTVAKDEAGRAAIAAAAMYVLRSMHPKAHSNEVIARDKEAFADPKLIAWKDRAASCEFKIGHAYYVAKLAFNEGGVLSELTLEDTGRRCK